MRALAARWNFEYIGPSVAKWGFPSFPKIRPPFPASFSLTWYPASEIRQVFNVIEGQQGGVSVLIFDSVLGEWHGVYCTFIACHTKQTPFGTDTSPEKRRPSGEWTCLYRTRFLQIPGAMSIKRIDHYLSNLQV